MGRIRQEIRSELIEFLGTLKENDKNDYVKAVAKVKWGDNPITLDIRNMNVKEQALYKGISLNDEEAERLTDLLLDNDYGSIDKIKEALQRRNEYMEDVHLDDKVDGVIQNTTARFGSEE